MRIITGSTGTTHVTSNDDGEFNQGIFGNGLIVFDNGNKLSASIIDNNTIRVEDGDLVFQGRHALIAPNTTEDITIETGMVGANRNDLIVARYVLDSATGYETITLEVLKGTETSGTAVDPEYATGDIRTGDLLVEVPLYRVKIEGINIVKLEALFEVTKDIISLIADLQNENSKLNSDVSAKSPKLRRLGKTGTTDEYGRIYLGSTDTTKQIINVVSLSDSITCERIGNYVWFYTVSVGVTTRTLAKNKSVDYAIWRVNSYSTT